jgi:hypothetical protein
MGAPLLINGQSNECRSDDWGGDTVFPFPSDRRFHSSWCPPLFGNVEKTCNPRGPAP